MKRKIAKLIIDFYQSKGVKDVFLLTGGAIAFIADEVRKNLITFWNTYSFFVTYANIDKFSPCEDFEKINSGSVLDQWILSELNSLIVVVQKSYDNFDATRASRLIQSFVTEFDGVDDAVLLIKTYASPTHNNEMIQQEIKYYRDSILLPKNKRPKTS